MRFVFPLLNFPYAFIGDVFSVPSSGHTTATGDPLFVPLTATVIDVVPVSDADALGFVDPVVPL